jgi:hypothetical protein
MRTAPRRLLSELPGFYFDEERQRYFRLQARQGALACAAAAMC